MLKQCVWQQIRSVHLQTDIPVQNSVVNKPANRVFKTVTKIKRLKNYMYKTIFVIIRLFRREANTISRFCKILIY